MRTTPTARCARCGVIRVIKVERDDSDVCGDCKSIARQGVKESDLELPPGKWVVGNGGVRRYVPTNPNARADMPELEHHEFVILDRLARNLAKPLPAPPPRPCCGDCGCLLAHTAEVCPGCLVWAERVAVSTSWRAAETRYTNADERAVEVAA